MQIVPWEKGFLLLPVHEYRPDIIENALTYKYERGNTIIEDNRVTLVRLYFASASGTGTVHLALRSAFKCTSSTSWLNFNHKAVILHKRSPAFYAGNCRVVDLNISRRVRSF
jgi:hypothetical protein